MKTEGFLNPILQNGKKGILLGLTYVLQIAGIAVLPLRLLKDAMQWCSRKISESYGMWFEVGRGLVMNISFNCFKNLF